MCIYLMKLVELGVSLDYGLYLSVLSVYFEFVESHAFIFYYHFCDFAFYYFNLEVELVLELRNQVGVSRQLEKL
jgi:hypothetical protein